LAIFLLSKASVDLNFDSEGAFFMTNALKKELAAITSLATLFSLKLKSPLLTSLLGVTSAGLLISSLQKAFCYKGKNVYITGGSRGLGLSLAWNLLEKEATVTLVARDIEELHRARDILLQDFPNASIFLSTCDVTDSAQLSQSLSQAIDRMNGIDLIINNAGSILVGPFSSMVREDFEAQMNLHLFAVLESTKLILPHFQNRGGGRILNICSLGGKAAVPHMLPYAASKFALAGFSQGIASELSPLNILVTTAYPTVMRTGSPIQAVFKGDHEKEFAWFEAVDNMPLLSMSADLAAKSILEAVASGKSELILSVPAKARMLMGAILPETLNAIMGLVAKVLPKKDSLIRKTGADSMTLFQKSFALKPLQRTASKEEKTYNQEPHHDAEFNMGLLH
jgi:short-subunit dehydrogenase